MPKCYYVDLPKREGVEDQDNSWTNVAALDTYEEAVDFCKEHWGAKDGKVDLITQGHRATTPRDQLLSLLETAAIKFGSFPLSSGSTSTYYINTKYVTLDPHGIKLVGQVILDLIRDENVEAIGGLAMGANPIVTAVARQSYDEEMPIPAFVVRNVDCWIEGPLPDHEGVRVAIVDDVVTSGASILTAAKAAESRGCQIVKLLALVDRLEGGREAIEEAGYDYVAVFTKHDLGIDREDETCEPATTT